VIDATGPAVSDQYRFHAERIGLAVNWVGCDGNCVQIIRFGASLVGDVPQRWPGAEHAIAAQARKSR
jgi:hypothetical protein